MAPTRTATAAVLLCSVCLTVEVISLQKQIIKNNQQIVISTLSINVTNLMLNFNLIFLYPLSGIISSVIQTLKLH